MFINILVNVKCSTVKTITFSICRDRQAFIRAESEYKCDSVPSDVKETVLRDRVFTLLTDAKDQNKFSKNIVKIEVSGESK